MTDRQPRNVVATIRQRLMNLARERGEDFQLVLTRYGIERLLYRLTQTEYGSQFVLKGAALFQLWTGESHRATRDLDLLGYGAPSPERLREVFQHVCSFEAADDGLAFFVDTVLAEQIKEDDEYQGIRLKIGHCLFGQRVVYGEGIFMTISPSPQHSGLVLLLSRCAPSSNQRMFTESCCLMGWDCR